MKKAASSRNTAQSTEDFRSIITRGKVTPISLNSFAQFQYQSQMPRDSININFKDNLTVVTSSQKPLPIDSLASKK